MYRICPAEVVRYAKARQAADARSFKQGVALHHFGASMQRAKRIPPLKSILRKTDQKPGSLFKSLRDAIRGAAGRNQKKNEDEKKEADPT